MAEKLNVFNTGNRLRGLHIYRKTGPPSDSSEAYSDSDFDDDGNKYIGTPGPVEPKPVSSNPPISMSSLPSTPTATKYLEPVLKLDSPRFRNPQAGSTLKLKLLTKSPIQTSSKPVFELAEHSERYEKMEKEMYQYYKMLASNSFLQPYQISQGCHAVLMDGGGNSVHRIKFLANPLQDSVWIEMIDCYVKKAVDIKSCFLFLHEAFAKLPPRVAAIDMEGMSNYLNHELFRLYATHTSEQFLFDGELTALVQPSGKVVVYNDVITKEFLYGINGYITKTFIARLQEPKLPPLGQKGDVFVVYSENNGVISLQMDSVVGGHYREIFNSISHDNISRLKGTVKLHASDQSKSEDVYFAPSQLDGTYYRARIVSQINDEKVHVSFIDYGDEANANISELVPCQCLHPLMGMFPPQCIKARLENIETLKATEYFFKYHSSDQPYIVQVVKKESEGSLAEVVLWPKDDGEKSVNEKMVENKLGTPIDPTYKSENAKSYAESCSSIYNLYLVLSGGRRLKTGMDLKVKVTHHESMKTMFFITPTDQRRRLEELEIDLHKEYKLPWNKKVHPDCWTEGEAMLCYSKVLKKVSRAMLVKPIGDQHILQEDEEEETLLCSCWNVYLMDYGISEIIPASYVRMMLPKFTKPPAFGIRVRCVSTGSEEITTRLTLCRTVTVGVQSVSNDKFGEIADVTLEAWQELHQLSISRIRSG